MNFSFWCVLPDGRENSLNTVSLHDAPRMARKFGAVKCYGFNPNNKVRFVVDL